MVGFPLVFLTFDFNYVALLPDGAVGRKIQVLLKNLDGKRASLALARICRNRDVNMSTFSKPAQELHRMRMNGVWAAERRLVMFVVEALKSSMRVANISRYPKPD